MREHNITSGNELGRRAYAPAIPGKGNSELRGGQDLAQGSGSVGRPEGLAGPGLLKEPSASTLANYGFCEGGES
jgi:hypothetical protein